MVLLLNNPPILWLFFVAYWSLSAFSKFWGFCLFVLVQIHHWTVHIILQLLIFLDALQGLASFSRILSAKMNCWLCSIFCISILPILPTQSLLWNHKQLGRSKSSCVPALVSASFWHLAELTSRKTAQIKALCLLLHLDLSLLYWAWSPTYSLFKNSQQGNPLCKSGVNTVKQEKDDLT